MFVVVISDVACVVVAASVLLLLLLLMMMLMGVGTEWEQFTYYCRACILLSASIYTHNFVL